MATLLALLLPARAQTETPPPSAAAIEQAWPNQPVLASAVPAGVEAEELLGRDVLTQDGEELGKLRDLVIDLDTGEVRYGVVGAGGLFGIGETRRLVPIAAMTKREGEEPALVLQSALSEQQWEDAPAFSRDELALLAEEEVQQRINAHFTPEASPETGSDPGTVESNPAGGPAPASGQPQLVLASDLRGMEVRHGDMRIGQVDAVLVLFAAREALLRLDPDPTTTGTNDQYLIVLSRVSADETVDQSLQTEFSAADFQRARPDFLEDPAQGSAAE